MTRSAHTFVVLDIAPDAFGEITHKLREAGYHHCFTEHDGRIVIDMSGIAVACLGSGLTNEERAAARAAEIMDAGERVRLKQILDAQDPPMWEMTGLPPL